MTRKERQSALALLPEERAGWIPTANAGAVLFSATFLGRPGSEAPAVPPLPLDPAPGARLFHVRDTHDHASAARTVSCEVRALHPEDLAAALDALLTRVTARAALAEAVLETRAVRLNDFATTPPRVVGDLARHLHRAGLPASFGPSWGPAQHGADASVGIRGLEEAFEEFLREHPAWRPAAEPVADRSGANFASHAREASAAGP